MTVDHLCFNGLCVNPAHLEAVSSSENSSRFMRLFWSRRDRGMGERALERQGLAKALRATGLSHRAIATELKVHQSTISRWLAGKSLRAERLRTEGVA